LLLRRRLMAPEAAVEHLLGMQAQIPNNPYVGLWSRLADFDPEPLSSLLAERRAVRTTLMRGTLHLVSAADCIALRPAIQPTLERMLYSGSPYGRRLKDIDVAALLDAGREILTEQPRTSAELRPLLHARWPEHDDQALAYAIQYLVPLVQVPPRGQWGRSGRPTWATADAWLGQAVPVVPTTSPDSPDPATDAMIVRYLAGYGPASIQDVQAWSGRTGLRPSVERLRPRLRTFRDERGRELFDEPSGPLPDPDTPAPPRFLPEYDNALLGYADRARIVTEEARQQIWTENGYLSAILIDGFVGGQWKVERKRKTATLTARLFGEPSSPDRAAVEEEAERLLRFLAPDAVERRIEVLGVGS
jgi:hypothetical protein